MHTPENSELGKHSKYSDQYDPQKLFPIARKNNRDNLGLSSSLPFNGYDIWNHYEVSWLNEKGKPIVAIAQIIFDCASENIIESKSMKLYFNSFNNTVFKDKQTLKNIIKQDLQERLQASFLDIQIIPLHNFPEQKMYSGFPGFYLDQLDISCDTYHTNPQFLQLENNEIVEEVLCSDLLKSNCLVTNQPDWGSLQITYKGKKIRHEGLLKYIISFRNDNEFHEHCIEKIFLHIQQHCQPQELTVYGRSTRRGGIDINSYRSTKKIHPTEIANIRLCRQ